MTFTPDVRETWPTDPYKGFAYYTFEDLPLFTGREDDVDACVAYLAEPRTRTLLLHGRTGCGKSSFLRAGLIPALEERGFGYVFLRRAPDEQPVFIRCTADPMARIAEEIFWFTEQPFRVQTAIDTREIDLSSARMSYGSIGSFVHACHDPDILLKALQAISEKCLRTIVIILDQAEEAMPQTERQSTFFDFLKLFNATNLRVKLLIALRTERFGEFFDFVHLDASINTDVKQYFLRGLDRSGVKRAIELPTLKEPVIGDRSPFEVYGFRFETRPEYCLIDEIVEDLFEAPPSGGILPLMQIVCRSLYNDVSSLPPPRIITQRLYRSGGGLAGRVDMQIGAALSTAIRKVGLPLFVEVSEHVRKWRSVLYKFVRTQPDGTVISDVIDETALLSMLKRLGTLKQVQSVLAELTDPRVLLLRRFDVTTAATGRPVTLYSLGHDAIGLALRQWSVREEEAKKGRRYFRSAAAGVVALLFALSFFVYQFNEQRIADVDVLQWTASGYFRHSPGIAATMAISASAAAKGIWWGKPHVDPNATLAKMMATLPQTTIRPQFSQPIQSSPVSDLGYALPKSGLFAFWSATSGVELVSWDGKQHVKIDPSELYGGTPSSKVALGNVTEAAPGVILFRFDVLGNRRAGFITIVKEGKVIAIKDLESFVASSPFLQWRINEMQSTGSVRTILLRVDRHIVSLVILTSLDKSPVNKWLVIQTFALGEDLLFRPAGIIEYREPSQEISVLNIVTFPNGIVSMTLTVDAPRGTEGGSGKLLSDFKMFDAKGEQNRSIWSLRDLKNSAVKHCLDRLPLFDDEPMSSNACAFSQMQDRFLVIKVLTRPATNDDDKRSGPGATLVVVDIATGQFMDIPWTEVQDSADNDAPFFNQRDQQGFREANIVVGGPNLDSMLLAVSDGAVFDVFRVSSGVPNFLGTYLGRLRGNRLYFGDDGAWMTLLSNREASMWDLSKPWESRVQAFEKKDAATLIKQICDAHLPAPSNLVPRSLPIKSNPCEE